MYNKLIKETILKLELLKVNLELPKLLDNYNDNKKNNYVEPKDFHKIPKTELIKKNINIDIILQIIKSLKLNKEYSFNFYDSDNKSLCNKIFHVSNSNLTEEYINKVFKNHKLKRNCVIDDKTNNKLTKKINNMKVSSLTAINHYTDSNEKSMKKNLINKEVVILFVYSGSFKYWIDIIKNNNYIDYITKYKNNYVPYYENFGKFKKEKGDFNNVRILNNFDRISKLLSKYINYSSGQTIMNNMNKDMILSLAKTLNDLFGWRMLETQQYIHNKIISGSKIVLLDLSKAFDNINKDFLNLVLSNYYPEYIINFINYQMFTINKKGTNIHNDYGISQGHPLSTTLFHLCHNIICQYIKEKISDIDIKIFVDDIALYYNKAISNDIINNNNKIISDIYDIFGLTINNKKTLTINIDDNNIWKNEYYLGVPMSNNYKDVRKCLDNKYGKELIDNLEIAFKNNIIKSYDIYTKSLKFSLAYRLKFIKEFNTEEEKQKFMIDMKNDSLLLYNIYTKYNEYEFIYMNIDNENEIIEEKDIDNILPRINLKNTDISNNELYCFI